MPRVLPTFVIGLREGVEAALIVGIVAAFLRQQGARRALRWMWTGVGLAVAICVAGGVALELLSQSLPQAEQEALETVVGFIAVAMVTFMVVWMRRNARGLRATLERDAAGALARGSAFALVGMAFFAVIREGFETAVFLLAAFDSADDPAAAGGGALIGVVVATVIGVAVYRGGIRLDLGRFFRITGAVLVLVAAGLVASALHTGHEAGWFNGMQGQAVDLRWLVDPGSIRSALLTGMLGLQPRPVVLETLGYVLYAVPMGLYVLWPAGRRISARPATAGLAAVIGLAAAACGGTSSPSPGEAGGTARTVHVTLLDAGCDPAALHVPAGPTTFEVRNDGAGDVTEFEILDGARIVGEVENLAPGLSGTFSLTLEPGRYVTYCPGGSEAEKGTLTVSGATQAVASAAATHAVAMYRRYVERETALLVTRTQAFATAVKAGEVDAAKRLYGPARVHYERVEPVAESFGALDPAIDARAGDVPAASWTGFHPLEQALWVRGDVSTPRAAKLATGLVADVLRLQRLTRTVELEPAQIANGAVELLGEVSKSKITGEEERYSHIDLVDFQANVEGARAAFDAVRPIVAGRDPALARQITTRFTAVDSAVAPYRRGTEFVPYTSLTAADTRGLSRAVGALAEPLSRVGAIVVSAP